MTTYAITYGALDITGRGVAIMAIVTVSLMGLATILYTYDKQLVGVIAHFASFVLAVTLMTTWLTSLDQHAWDEAGPFPVVGAVILLAINVLGPLWADDRLS